MKPNKSFIILFGGRIAQAILALVAIRALTTFLPKDEVGLTYLITSLSSYFSLIFINPVGMYLNRKIHLWNESKLLSQVFKALNRYFVLISVLSVPIVILSYFGFKVGLGFQISQLCILIFLNIFIGTWFQTLCPSLNMLEERSAFVKYNLAAQLIGLVLAIIGVMFVETSAFLWLLGLLIGQAIGALLSFAHFVRALGILKSASPVKSEVKGNLVFNRELVSFSFPIAITTALMWTQNHSYRVFVESQMGAEALAVLGVGLGVATSISGLVESLVNQYFYPKYYATVAKAGVDVRAKAWEELFSNAVSVYLPTTLFLIFCGPFILKLLVNEKFSDALPLVLWGAAIELTRMLTNIIYAVSQSEMKTKKTILPYGFGAVTVVVGLYLITSQLHADVYSVPAVLLVAGTFVLISMYLSMKGLLSIKLPIAVILRSLVISSPLSAALLLSSAKGSLIGSFLVCGAFAGLLLLIIYILQTRNYQAR